MKVLITGSSGFLGQGLIQKLLDDGHEITLLGRTPVDIPNTRFVKADIASSKDITQAHQETGDVDVLVHMAALVPKTMDEDTSQAMCDTNVCGTINLLETFGSKLKNVVYASTAEVYGLSQGNDPITEDMVPTPLSYYGASKLAGELFARVYGKRNRLPVSMLRFTVMYGPGDMINRAVPNFINKALAGESLEIYGGEELRDYIHVDDAIQALYLAATKNVEGIFNIGTGKGISIKDTAELIARKVNPDLEAKILPREKPAADIVLDITRAKTELGFEPKYTFPDKLEEQIEWQKKR